MAGLNFRLIAWKRELGKMKVDPKKLSTQKVNR